VALLGTLYFFIYTRVNAQKDEKKDIWVPPKAQPKLPFGLGPPPKELVPADFKKTTYKVHETDLLKEAAGQLVMTVVISLLMSYKFQVHFSLLMQAVMLPLGIYDNILFKKYILGQTKKPDGSLLYGEVYREPTAESIALAARVAALRANGSEAAAEPEEKKETTKTVPSVAKSAIGPDEPRVEELPDEDESKQDKKASTEAVSAHDID
jgi:hypothetical protein